MWYSDPDGCLSIKCLLRCLHCDTSDRTLYCDSRQKRLILQELFRTTGVYRVSSAWENALRVMQSNRTRIGNICFCCWGWVIISFNPGSLYLFVSIILLCYVNCSFPPFFADTLQGFRTIAENLLCKASCDPLQVHWTLYYCPAISDLME